MRRFVIAILALALLTGCQAKREIVSSISERQANEIIVFLAAKGIDAEKEAKTTSAAGGGDTAPMFSVYVPASESTEALSILNRNGLPRRPSATLLSLFAKSGLVSSAQEEQIRYQEGLSEQMAGTIRMIDGVINAVVQISFPSQETSFPGQERDQPQVTASVYVKHQGVLDDPNSQLVTKIKRLVASGVVGLEFDNVTVITDRARFTDVTLSEDPDLLPDEERDYTRIWTVIVAKESASRFRTIFLILCLGILLLAAFCAWIVWKTFPAIQASGGTRELFGHTRPLHFEGLPERKKKKKKTDEEEEESYEFPDEEDEEE